MPFTALFVSDACTGLACLQFQLLAGKLIIRVDGSAPDNASEMLVERRKEFVKALVRVIGRSDSTKDIDKSQASKSVKKLHLILVRCWDKLLKDSRAGREVQCEISSGTVWNAAPQTEDKGSVKKQPNGGDEAVEAQQQQQTDGKAVEAQQQQQTDGKAVEAQQQQETDDKAVVAHQQETDGKAVVAQQQNPGDEAVVAQQQQPGDEAVVNKKNSKDKLKLKGGVTKSVEAKKPARKGLEREVIVNGQEYVLKSALQKQMSEHLAMYESSMGSLEGDLYQKSKQISELKRSSVSGGM